MEKAESCSAWRLLTRSWCAAVSSRDGQWVARDSRDARSSRGRPGKDGRNSAGPRGQEEIRRVSNFPAVQINHDKLKKNHTNNSTTNNLPHHSSTDVDTGVCLCLSYVSCCEQWHHLSILSWWASDVLATSRGNSFLIWHKRPLTELTKYWRWHHNK